MKPRQKLKKHFTRCPLSKQQNTDIFARRPLLWPAYRWFKGHWKEEWSLKLIGCNNYLLNESTMRRALRCGGAEINGQTVVSGKGKRNGGVSGSESDYWWSAIWRSVVKSLRLFLILWIWYCVGRGECD